MPLRNIGDTDVQYYLISFDEHGVERREPDGSLLSETVKERLADRAEKISDVFFASHGWKGDVPAAIEQYDKWMGAMVRSPDRQAVRQKRPEFKALNVGLHWPSLPFGDENIPGAGGGRTLSGGSKSTPTNLDAQVDQYAASIADTPVARGAIRTILTAATQDDGRSEALSPDVRNAYETLYAEARPRKERGGPGAPPGADYGDSDADAMYRAARQAESESVGGGRKVLSGGGLLDKLKGLIVAPMQQLSFWKMKDRARAVGESGGHALLASFMNAAPATRFHLMGHSFGCIVVSATVAGRPGDAALPRGVDSLFLVQGALSLWSFCPDIPFAHGTSGYFNRILAKELVRGPIITTRSTFDSAVGKLYPPAAEMRNQLTLDAKLPKFGGVGTFGAQGLGDVATDEKMQPESYEYGFEPKHVYNLDASGVIRNGGGFSGAHSDIAHPEVAHVMWQAVAAAP